MFSLSDPSVIWCWKEYWMKRRAKRPEAEGKRGESDLGRILEQSVVVDRGEKLLAFG